jgi:transposase
MGDALMRTALYEAALVLLTRVKRWCALKAWAAQVSRRRGHKEGDCRAGAAHRRFCILHRMWVDGTNFQWGTAPTTAAAS